MPYILQEAQAQIRHGRPPMNAGELNYTITLQLIAVAELICSANITRTEAVKKIENLILRYWNAPWHKQNYQLANDIGGALSFSIREFKRRDIRHSDQTKDVLAKLIDQVTTAFYDRIVVPYEDKKIIENGDVYP